jgi:hypothetical protein
VLPHRAVLEAAEASGEREQGGSEEQRRQEDASRHEQRDGGAEQ